MSGHLDGSQAEICSRTAVHTYLRHACSLLLFVQEVALLAPSPAAGDANPQSFSGALVRDNG